MQVCTYSVEEGWFGRFVCIEHEVWDNQSCQYVGEGAVWFWLQWKSDIDYTTREAALEYLLKTSCWDLLKSKSNNLFTINSF